MSVDVRAAGGIGDGGRMDDGTKVRLKNNERRGRRGGTSGNITKNALVGDGERIRRAAVFELVDTQRDLRQQKERRNPDKKAAAPHHVRHRTSSSAMPRNNVK